MSRAFKNKMFSALTGTALLACLMILLALISAIIFQGAKALSPEFLFTPARDFGASGGLLYQISGSLLIVLSAALLVLPVAVGTAIYQNYYLKDGRAKETLDMVLFTLNAVPSITYGLFGLIFFVNILGTGLSWFVGSIILAIMMLPTVTLSCGAAMASVPALLLENASALGLSRGEVVKRVLLPQSAGGIVTGLLIALARAIGETAPIMFIATAFSGVGLPRSLLEPVATLPTHILALAQQSTNPDALRNAWGASLILVAFVALFSAVAFVLRRRFTSYRSI